MARLKSIIAGSEWKADEIVTQENGRFYFDLAEGYLDVQLVADGYRKIATLYYLLRNGSLTKDSILFWDEPEANLNPKLVVEVRYDHFTGHRFRHGTKFLRWRPNKSPRQCTMEQVMQKTADLTRLLT